MKLKYLSKYFLLTIIIIRICPGCKVENKKLILTFMETKGIIHGWGHSVVIQTPDGYTYMYDTGPNYPDAGFDCGKDMIAPFLVKNNIKEIDGIVISHSHNDHFGGFEYLMNNFKIKKLFDSGYTFTSDSEYDSLYKPEYIAKGGVYELIKQGDKLNWGKYLSVMVLSPPKDYLEDDTSSFNDPILHHNPNLNSIVLHLKYKNEVFLFVGDLNSTGQKYLLKQFSAKELKTTVLCLAHGDGEAYLPFAEAIKPEIVVESCINGNDSPAKNAEKLYSQVGSRVYATCWGGKVQVVSDGNTCTVTTERNDMP
jgi:competence protein ComEC